MRMRREDSVHSDLREAISIEKRYFTSDFSSLSYASFTFWIGITSTSAVILCFADVTLRHLLKPYDEVQIIGETGDGKPALEMLASYQPDVIILDLNMPRMNGIEAAPLIRKHGQIPWSLASAMRDSYIMEAFLKAGVLAVISKDRLDELPIRSDKLAVAGVQKPET
jgi:CheY-like chemotaxis protein